MDIRTIEAFLVLADCLNFTKSADKVYLTQPALSRQITRLEREFGCELFTRTKRKVELTEYGKAFAERAKGICSEYEKWKLTLKHIQNGSAGRLSLGFLRDYPSDFLAKMIQEFGKRHPDIAVNFSDLGLNSLVDGVLRGDIDCAFSVQYNIEKYSDIEFLAVDSERICVALHEKHPLAEHASLKVQDLADCKFVMVSSEEYTKDVLPFQSICKEAGIEPNIVANAAFVPSMLILVQCGVGVGIITQGAQALSPGCVRFVPLDSDIAYGDIVLFWKKDTKNSAVPLFVKTAKSLL
jgi:DNA-binding transcriptional LysR family regulator